jgi:hypothetical protein
VERKRLIDYDPHSRFVAAQVVVASALAAVVLLPNHRKSYKILKIFRRADLAACS